MVRLKVNLRQNFCLILDNFNSTMVRLKVNETKFASAAGTQFQFHYGTIKSVLPYEDLYIRDKFQFHYGTIKSYR